MTTPLTWHDVLAEEKQQPYFFNTLSTVAAERQSGQTIYPPQKDVFNAFRYTELSDVKVVILGQDPYHGPGQAWLSPLLCSICIKSLREPFLALPAPPTVTWKAGRIRVCCC